MLNLLGAAAALYLGSSIDWTKFTVFQLVVSSSQVAGATANEYADIGSDILNMNRTWFSGGSGMVASGKVSKKTALYGCAFWTGMAIAGASTLAFLMGTGVASFLLMMLGVALALSYSLRPLMLSYRGVGELSMAFMVSFLTPVVSFYVLYGSFDRLIVLATLPLVFQMLGLMMVVEYPDREADAASRKRNLVVRFGRDATWALGVIMLVVGGAFAFYGGLFGLPFETAVICGTILLAEATVFWMLSNRLVSKSALFWSTAASCAFYVTVILTAAVTIAIR